MYCLYFMIYKKNLLKYLVILWFSNLINTILITKKVMKICHNTSYDNCKIVNKKNQWALSLIFHLCIYSVNFELNSLNRLSYGVILFWFWLFIYIGSKWLFSYPTDPCLDLLALTCIVIDPLDLLSFGFNFSS